MCLLFISIFSLAQENREEFTFIVPTGNFGNVLAGWMVQQMGVPIKGFQVATNKNDILVTDYWTCYAQEVVGPSLAPSMDIQAGFFKF